ncbi:MAG: enoyl-CoA hydratase/isomerase family protein [Immundisolibacter sp.]|uniref:enoyl-CoA hydratase/isomerase family protein n=1 Tax=Immundisolibacter sp. TaxID=1934948 RepID=UPI003563902D
MTDGLLNYELRADHIAILTMNRPEKMNALNAGLAGALVDGLRRFDADQDAWVGILTGTGKAFCAGADLENMRVGSADGGDWVGAIDHLQPLFEAIEGERKPLIAAVNGFCMGGGLGLAHSCSLIVAIESAKFGMPEAAVGVPNFSYFDLWKTVGYRRALEMSLTADPYPASHMLDIGFLNQVVPDAQLMQAALALAARIAKNAPLATAGAEQGMKFTLHNPREAWPAAARQIWKKVLASDDLREGLAAFEQRRKPTWGNS